MQYIFFVTNTLSEEMVKKYYPMLTEHKRKKIADEPDPHARAVYFCSEICARICLSREFEAPEFSFSLLINPNGASAVSNFTSSLCIVNDGDYIACAVDKRSCGVGMCRIDSFEFTEAQSICSDRELRDIFSYSVYSFADIVNRKNCDESAVCERFALDKALKDAYFRASGRAVKSNFKYAEFYVENGEIVCSDKYFTVNVHEYHKNSGYVVCVLTGRTK